MDHACRLLMCPPDFYQVNYVINPWMEGNLARSSPRLAAGQWRQLYDCLGRHAEIVLVNPRADWPDMVFTANAGLVLGDQVVLSRFFHRERRGEEPFFRDWFEQHGFTVHELPEDLPFEGAGDALFDRGPDGWLWAGYGFRSELESHVHLARLLDREVLSLRLVDRRFYHLDTCFCPLEGGYLLYYPAAFDTASLRLIEARVPAARRLVVPEADAVNFAANAINVGRTVLLHHASEALHTRLTAHGFRVEECGTGEFLKAGGACKCLTLRLTETAAATVPRPAADRDPDAGSGGRSGVARRVVVLAGHLLDSGLLDRALDLTIDAGGSFRILNFQLGRQRQSTSQVDLQVAAPSAEALEGILAQLIDLGARPVAPAAVEQPEAALLTVAQEGVAPEDFYTTTIYPTEVRVRGRWVRVRDQRMDGCIVVAPHGGPGGEPAARLRLMRDLRPGEQVVVGVDGIRTVRPVEARDGRPEAGAGGAAGGREEFAFMGANVSSERRVELVVRQIAWELRRIRAHEGKVVVVAGPVVIHTGGGEHLAAMIREGYVQALLGGNAIAVHDVEQALLGTSLGVDLQRGAPVHGGHRHHLRAINVVRRCGSLRAAVEQGVLTTGIFYECVRRGVPFSLAGSIRDDGPLPDTRMDLLVAQQEYADLIAGAEMILMLSSMLHAIGVGNMTPAGVKLVCVDINPAVVTKLSDRGSVESTGVVTDVGLFLSLLQQQLRRQDGEG